MRAYHPLIVLAALLATAGVAAAQNAPCPECDPDGEPVENSYYSVDIGVIEENSTEILADSDASHSHDDHEKGFWLWLSLCFGAFVQHVEDILGIHTDVDANVQVYADSEGVDVDATTHGLQHVCGAAGITDECDYDFDKSELGDADGLTYEAIAEVERVTGVDVFVPAFLPDTGDGDVDVCVRTDLTVC